MHATDQALRPVGEAANTPYAERYRSLLSLAYTLNGNTDLGRQTLANADQTTDNYHATQYLWAQAILERAEGELVEAEATAHQCLSICRTMKIATVEVETIEVLVGLAADLESHDVAARLLGAADARRDALGYVRPPIMRPSHDSYVATLVDAIGSERYERVLAEGTAMSWDEALDYVTRGRGQRKRPSSGWASLTPAELAVVNLVADDHQQSLRRFREGLDPAQVLVLDVTGDSRAGGDAEATRELCRSHPSWQLQQPQGVPAGLGHNPISNVIVQSTRDARREQGPTVLLRESFQRQRWQCGEEPLVGPFADGEQQRDGFSQQASADEGQNLR